MPISDIGATAKASSDDRAANRQHRTTRVIDATHRWYNAIAAKNKQDGYARSGLVARSLSIILLHRIIYISRSEDITRTFDDYLK